MVASSPFFWVNRGELTPEVTMVNVTKCHRMLSVSMDGRPWSLSNCRRLSSWALLQLARSWVTTAIREFHGVPVDPIEFEAAQDKLGWQRPLMGLGLQSKASFS